MDRRLLNVKKVLIISYFYPPANFVGGKRPATWVKYLHESGYYPIVVTRQWNEGQTDLVDKLYYNKLEVTYYKTHEIHKLPFKRSFRDSCSKYHFLKPIQKGLTLFELISSNFFIEALPFANFYHYSKKLIKNDSTISIVIASGRPFQSYSIGYQLKKDFPSIRWIPEYRDEWSTHPKYNRKGILNKIIHYMESKSEIKWTSNSYAFISVSERLVKNISNKIGKIGISIPNGFEMVNNIPKVVKAEIKEKVTLSYAGTLYDYQPIERVVNAFKEINNTLEIPVVLEFYGVEMILSVKEKLEKLISGYEDYFFLHKKVDKKTLLMIQQNSDFLFLTNYTDINDWLVVKLIDYSVTGIPVILFPSDNGIMSDFINKTNIGYSLKNENEFYNFFNSIIKIKKIEKQINKSILENYSVKKQVEKLSVFLSSDEILLEM